MTKMLLNKAKVMNIKLEEDYIENNIIDLPFIFYYKTKEPVTAITYSWTSSDFRKRAIEVRSSKLGVPDAFCYDVLLALFRLYIKQNGNRIIQIKTEEGLNEIDNTINFTYRELVREVGYKSFSKLNKDKVQKAIETLIDTTIYNKAGGIYNPMSKEYIVDETFTINILYNFKNYTYIELRDENGNLVLDEEGLPVKTLNKASLKDKCSIKIDRFFIKNLFFGNAKLSSRELRLALKNEVAKKLYLILNKWQNNRNEMTLKYETLYNRIPLTDYKDDYYRKRRLKDALNELVSTNFLHRFEMRKSDVLIVFRKQDDQDKNNSPKYLLDKYNTYEEIMDAFAKHGISDKDIETHFKIHKMPYYQAVLRYIDHNLSRIENTTSYLFKGLVTDYADIGSEYYNA